MAEPLEEEIQQLNELKADAIAFVTEKGVSIVVAIILFYLGWWLSKKLSGLVLGLCNKRNLDATLSRFFAGTVKFIIIAFAGMIALEKAGIEVTPFIALLGASAFGLSLAVQGPISNYGAGIVLIVTRPFKVGDTLSVQGCTGLVDEIKLGFTELVNEDEERITIPNRKVLGEVITNSYEFIKYEGIVGIEYAADPEKAVTVITEAIKGIDGVAPERNLEVGIDEFGDSSVNIGYRVMVETKRLHETRYRVNMAVWKALKENGLNIPFPQRDVHLFEVESNKVTK